nr:hypothetical protein [uncultured Pseudomonas sp.]
MSLHMLWGLIAAHPTKLINVLALLLTCPGGLLLQSARRREADARQGLGGEERALARLAGWVPRQRYSLGVACLAAALLLSWVSTWA